ncbi:MAG TPA: DNA polymerase III subunit alpha, partial [Bacteroidia bacterium]|nr:DNA polymerase III subunit alpha [Bacteroidia bacterium]
MSQFSHLHVHTQFSLLDGAADISKLYKKAAAHNMPAIAITDHGNMFGAFEFVAEAYKHKGADGKPKVKPIVGCEFYLVENRFKRAFTKDDKDQRFHQLFLAKNAEGYQNLIKMCSLGYMEGLYGKYPRIDKELVKQYHKGLIATTCCLGASVPRAIMSKGEDEAEKEFQWWLNIFGEDYYIELQRHDIPEQNKVNEVLVKWAFKYNVKMIASNDTHYVDQQDANAHDILLCINTGEKQSTPTMKEFSDDEMFSKGKRFAFYNDQFYFKTPEEMSQLFVDLPEAIDNTNAIVDKIEILNLKKDILLPNYVIPEGFTTQDEYLKHITYLGAKNRYKDLTPEIEERLNFELHTVKTMGFAGYFLIVADFIKAGRDMGVFVGPGRGSAAGSAVAYCIGITNIDPIKYNLLFERFLNPDRKSMPDIDTDFDDEGRQKVIDYVVKKYGKNQVAQIVTYGSMAA